MPTFLEDKPTDKDTLWETHKKLSETLKNIIDNLSKNNSVKNIIGLFWDWWSWKSSIIEMIRKNNENYQVFEFDSWSHKDEFLKRAFLIELTKDLGYKGKSLWDIGFTRKWFEKINTIDYLSKKNLVKTLHVEPNTSFSWIWFWWALILFTLLFKFLWIDIIWILIKWISPILSLEIWKWLSSLYFQYLEIFNLFLFIILWVIFYKGFYPNFKIKEDRNSKNIKKNEKNETEKDSKVKNDDKWFKSLIDYILFKKINYSETLTSSENEDFSNYDYQEYFKFIVKKYLSEKKNKEKKLIIVLDNLDRVNDDIVLNSISLIQTTLEWIKEENWENIFERLIFILPIDKDRLKKVFEKLIKDDLNNIEKNNFTEWFIDKTFSVIVDVPSLEQADWRKYFKEKFIKAFLEEKIEEINIEYLISSFYIWIKTNNKNITPREIINFINELVSNYLYFNDSINLKYQWIYILLKRYYSKFLKEIIWKEENKKEINKIYIKEPKKLLENEVIKKIGINDYKKLLENILRQIFKADNVYNLIYLDEFLEGIKDWNTDKVNNLLKEINNSDKEKSLIESAYWEIEKIKDLGILGKVAKVIFETENKNLSFYKNNILKLIKDSIKDSIKNVENIDKKSAEWILKLLEKYNDKETKYIKNELPKNLIGVILSNKLKENE